MNRIDPPRKKSCCLCRAWQNVIGTSLRGLCNSQHQLTTPKICRSSTTKVPTEIHQTVFSTTTNKNGKSGLGMRLATGRVRNKCMCVPHQTCSGVARPGPTRACALPSTFQALPSAAQHDSRDSIKIRKYSSYSS